MNKRTIIASQVVAIFLAGCAPTEDATTVNWKDRGIQIEQLASDGRRYARDPILSLSSQQEVIGHAVGRPDYGVTFDVVAAKKNSATKA